MDASLLATKLQIPPQRERGVRRQRPMDSLEGGVVGHRLILLSAPAGYGKTTLLADWVRSSRFRAAWLSLDEGDNDVFGFLHYLTNAWASVQASVRQSELGLLVSATEADAQTILAAFVNLAHEVDEHLVFVLDDYHLMTEPTVNEALAFVLDNLPPTVHFVIAGRREPALPVARYRARAQLLELHATDLAFSADETTVFLDEVMGVAVGPAESSALHSRLEGWAAGLQLAALSLRNRSEAGETPSISGQHRFVADYLSEDVLAGVAPDVRRFLLQTSILDRFCASLCDAVTEGEGGQSMLEILERENLFLVPLDDRREWFRYHQLFAEFLREALYRRHGDETTDLHRRAAAWHLAHDFPDQAFRHATAADAPRLVADILDRYTNAKLMAGELRTVQQWLDAIKPEWYEAFPVLGLSQAGYLAFSGAYEACLRRVDQVETQLSRLTGDDADWQRARVTAVRCMLACIENDLPRAEAYAARALEQLPRNDLGFRPGVYAALGDTYRQNVRWDEAKACYLKVLDFTQSPGVQVQAAHVFGALADLNLRQGRLREAAGYWHKALAAIHEREQYGRLPLPVSGWVHIRLGELFYEWNDFNEAAEQLEHGMARAELGGDVRALIAGYLLAGNLALAAGEVALAAQDLERARPLVEQAQFPEWVSRFERLQLDLWFAQDELRAAVNWSDEMLAHGALESRPDSELTQLALARVLIVKGDASSLDRAQGLLAPLLDAAEVQGRKAILIEGNALAALALWRLGERPAAIETLARALSIAEPEGFIRLFLDLGPSVTRLLQEAHFETDVPDYVAALLRALGAGAGRPGLAAGGLLEPLSPRELEILQLLAGGKTNREIADALVISPETVKKHASTIYGKMDVSNRTEAAAKARALGLLD